ncbi:MAG: sugar ABC transporter permease [Clostridiaceae bacterium]|nr:sugar ABC transporter permease [Clostridiaceae bacterium]
MVHKGKLMDKNTQVLRSLRRNKSLLIMLILPVTYYLIFHYGPMYGAQIAFKDYKFLKGIWGSKWVGFENFKFMFENPSFRRVFLNTLIISFLKLIFGYPAPIIFAILLNEVYHVKFKKTIQTVTYLPHFISWVVLVGLFRTFLSPSLGPINIFLKAIGGQPIFFIADPKWFRTVLVTTSIWKGFGWGSIVYLAAISSVDQEQYEAATIDGANRYQRALYITLPSIIPVITITFIFAVGGIINDDFDQIYNFLNDAVLSVGDVISTYTYRRGLISYEYSYASAVGLFKNVIGFILIIITNFISKKVSDNEYGIW